MREEAIRRRLNVDSDSDSEGEGMGWEGDDGSADCLSENVYTVPSTGARVTIYNAKSLLFHYCTKLPSDQYLQTPFQSIPCHLDPP